MEMLLRLPVVVSALAFVLAFISAPHQHLHRDTGVQHAHVTSHQDGHHHDDAPEDPNHEDRESGRIVSVTMFIAPGPASVITLDHADGPAVPFVMTDGEAAESVAAPESRTHGPPVRSSLTPRAPPVLPAS